MTLQCVMWDVDGTIAETERDGHRIAFNEAFAQAGLDWHWDVIRYGELLHTTGGRERILEDMKTRADVPTDAAAREQLAATLHKAKNARYAALVAEGAIALRPGVRELMDDCMREGVRAAIVTTTSRANLDALLSATLSEDWEQRFCTIVCGEQVQRKKPDPEAYLIALRELGLAERPDDCVAIEDSPPGLAAARAAGVPAIITRSVYFGAADFGGAIAVGPGLDRRDGWAPIVRTSSNGQQPARIRLLDVVAWMESR